MVVRSLTLDVKQELDERALPEDRCSPDRLVHYIENMQPRVRPETVRNRVRNLNRALAVMAPTFDRRHLLVALRNLPCKPDTAKKRRRVKEAAQLMLLGRSLMARAIERPRRSEQLNAVVFRDGLQICLLASRPIRLKNFTAIEIGEHLVSERDTWHLRVEEVDVKTYREIDVPFPTDLVPALEQYLHHWRPLMLRADYFGNRLWVTPRGYPESPVTITMNMLKRTRAAFGDEGLSPHLFRDSVATSLAVHDPEIVRISSTILGNSPAVCEKYYNQARSLEAGRALGATIDRCVGRFSRGKTLLGRSYC